MSQLASLAALGNYSFNIIRWGCTHEQSAVEAYTEHATRSHEGLKVTAAGLFIDCERLFVEASLQCMI